MPELKDLLRHFHSDPVLQDRYYEAQSIGAEVLAEETDDLVVGNDEAEIPMDPQRLGQVVNYRKWLISKRNKRYRETQQLEVTQTLDISEAMAKASERVEQLRLKREEKVIEHDSI